MPAVTNVAKLLTVINHDSVDSGVIATRPGLLLGDSGRAHGDLIVSLVHQRLDLNALDLAIDGSDDVHWEVIFSARAVDHLANVQLIGLRMALRLRVSRLEVLQRKLASLVPDLVTTLTRPASLTRATLVAVVSTSLTSKVSSVRRGDWG